MKEGREYDDIQLVANILFPIYCGAFQVVAEIQIRQRRIIQAPIPPPSSFDSLDDDEYGQEHQQQHPTQHPQCPPWEEKRIIDQPSQLPLCNQRYYLHPSSLVTLIPSFGISHSTLQSQPIPFYEFHPPFHDVIHSRQSPPTLLLPSHQQKCITIPFSPWQCNFPPSACTFNLPRWQLKIHILQYRPIESKIIITNFNLIIRYKWQPSMWSACRTDQETSSSSSSSNSGVCGGGVQMRSLTCLRLSDSRPVNPQLCRALNLLPIVQQ